MRVLVGFMGREPLGMAALRNGGPTPTLVSDRDEHDVTSLCICKLPHLYTITNQLCTVEPV